MVYYTILHLLLKFLNPIRTYNLDFILVDQRYKENGVKLKMTRRLIGIMCLLMNSAAPENSSTPSMLSMTSHPLQKALVPCLEQGNLPVKASTSYPKVMQLAIRRQNDIYCVSKHLSVKFNSNENSQKKYIYFT